MPICLDLGAVLDLGFAFCFLAAVGGFGFLFSTSVFVTFVAVGCCPPVAASTSSTTSSTTSSPLSLMNTLVTFLLFLPPPPERERPPPPLDCCCRGAGGPSSAFVASSASSGASKSIASASCSSLRRFSSSLCSSESDSESLSSMRALRAAGLAGGGEGAGFALAFLAFSDRPAGLAAGLAAFFLPLPLLREIPPFAPPPALACGDPALPSDRPMPPPARPLLPVLASEMPPPPPPAVVAELSPSPPLLLLAGGLASLFLCAGFAKAPSSPSFSLSTLLHVMLLIRLSLRQLLASAGSEKSDSICVYSADQSADGSFNSPC
mmetsp:Transcript_8495/g.20161  ORF Transcript_8495/g.20161 Transcript_8495/m.20161 type:complete len:321 (-) Transcript_8495:169-1131(-)